MRNLVLNAAVLSTLGQLAVAGGLALATTQASANWINLPTAGTAITSASTNQPTGTTSYYRCNTTGNYGSVTTTPATTTTDACHIVPTGGSRNNSPDSAIATTLVTNVRDLVINNSYTNNTNVVVGTIEERVWRNSNSSSCVYGLRISLEEDVDYDLNTPGTQTLELNGFARGGFSGFTATSGTNSIQAGYYHSTVTDEATFRIGRAYTSVQARAQLVTTSQLATGYVHRPLISPAPATGTAVNGVSTYTSPLPVPTAGAQTAAIRTNWVEFTTDNNTDDDDGTSKPDSSQFYVRANGTTTVSGCPAVNGSGEAVLTSGAYRFRQNGQEDAPMMEFVMDGYIPNGANTNY